MPRGTQRRLERFGYPKCSASHLIERTCGVFARLAALLLLAIALL
jgi:hypothetical protein